MSDFSLTKYLTSESLLYIFSIALCVYVITLSVYRLYLHPLSHFPGPKLSALTLWYEFYYDVVCKGQFTFEIARMHQQYGPIVRINPHELHISDPDFYDTLYVGAGTRRTEKYPWSARMFGNDGSMLSTVGHEMHRMRRQPLNPYFSRASVTRLEPMIKAKIEKLCQRLAAVKNTNEPIALDLAYICLTTDVIKEYCFAEPSTFLDRADFAPEWYRGFLVAMQGSLLQKQLGWFIPLMVSLPKGLTKIMNPDMAGYAMWIEQVDLQIGEIIAEKRTGVEQQKCNESHESDKAKTASTAPTIFHELLDSDIPDSEKTVYRLSNEARTLVAAGALTTAHFLKDTTYHIMKNPKILARLKEELKGVMPDAEHLPQLHELEKLPYFAAVMNEGFRITWGISSRLTRISPDQPLQFDEWTIPAAIPVGMTSMHLHRDTTLFPDPDVFDPERFLKGGEKLTKYLVNFSKGTRNCLGMNLARAEIHLTIAAVVARFGSKMELFETDRSDIDVKHDFFSPIVRLDSKGLRVIVKDCDGS